MFKVRYIKVLEYSVTCCLILWFCFSVISQMNLGLADNGDFTRSMWYFTNGPAIIKQNLPETETIDWHRRFFSNWIPDWKFQWNWMLPSTSSYILWIPGVVANYLFYSRDILHLPVVSLFPKIILLGVLGWVLILILKYMKPPLLFIFTFGFPLTLLLSTSDYLVYFNSFYQESASFVFLFLFLLLILHLHSSLRISTLILCILSLILLITAKQSNIYWTVISAPFIIFIWSKRKSSSFLKKILLTSLLIISIVLISVLITGTGKEKVNKFHSLFYGALTFSDKPSFHLQKLNMGDAVNCVGTKAFFDPGKGCFQKYYSQMNFTNTIQVIVREPQVAGKLFRHVINRFQDISLDYLCHHTNYDLRERSWMNWRLRFYLEENRSFVNSDKSARTNLWSIIKYNYFPRGTLLALTLILFLAWFVFLFGRNGIIVRFAFIGTLSTLACLTDMIVAILGDGKYELIKHLFLSNVLFDISAILFVNSLLIFIINLFKKVNPGTNSVMNPEIFPRS